ncbi:MAG: DUF4127 family protein [Mesotoga sp.]|jgi:hypothetical protein|uniref:DUF4127 family protein n=1 Tax=Mesotoga TaxID=1184396 RepID=UPI0002CC6EEF|nr:MULTISPECIES: DUF4127 family protein [Mesotoga]MCP5457525.1 DUF4127 family protein [Thermotogota bacterium]CCU84515.1 hypothetical protein PHOSAC3_121132 [Mesotoga infera]HNQ71291.1 DUF4127 family protein [Mesotoga prima]HNS76325.1 DUF4127 family protein [Mesotoga prima]HQC13695.1 DUF4127 family protein [Mesotoga prima]
MFSKRVVFLPVDERFCTRDYFLLLCEAAGGVLEKGSDEIPLIVNNPTDKLNAEDQPENQGKSTSFERVFTLLKRFVSEVTVIADVKYSNGSENKIIEAIMEIHNFDWNSTNYSGWNTAGNTIGTVSAHSVVQLLVMKNFLSLDKVKMKHLQIIIFLEHWAYKSKIRKILKSQLERAV